MPASVLAVAPVDERWKSTRHPCATAVPISARLPRKRVPSPRGVILAIRLRWMALGVPAISRHLRWIGVVGRTWLPIELVPGWWRLGVRLIAGMAARARHTPDACKDGRSL